MPPPDAICKPDEKYPGLWEVPMWIIAVGGLEWVAGWLGLSVCARHGQGGASALAPPPPPHAQGKGADNQFTMDPTAATPV